MRHERFLDNEASAREEQSGRGAREGSSPAVFCESLSKRYEDATALEDVSFACWPGTLTVIAGASGSGKTSLLRILGGMDRSFEGVARVDGIDLALADEAALDDLRRQSIGFVFQDYNLVPYLSVYENVALGLRAKDDRKPNDSQVACEALERVGLAEKADCLPRDLSGGECQRVAIARAVAKKPKVILADEPTGALDAKTASEIARLLASFAEEGRTVAVVTHDVDLFRPFAQQEMGIRDGRVILGRDDNAPEASHEDESASCESNRSSSRGMTLRTLGSLACGHIKSCFKRCLVSAIVCAVGALGLGVLFSLTAGMQNYSNDLQNRLLANAPIVIEQKLNLSAAHDDEDVDAVDGQLRGDGSIEQFVATANLPGKDAALPRLEEELLLYESDSPDVLSVRGDYPLTNDLYACTADGQWRFVDRWQLFEDVKTHTGGSSLFATDLIWSIPDSSSFFRALPSDDSGALSDKFELVEGRMPANPDEVIVVTQADGRIGDVLLALLGLLDQDIWDEAVRSMGAPDSTNNAEETSEDASAEDGIQEIETEDLLSLQLRLMQGCDYRVLKDGKWVNAYYERSQLDRALSQSMELKVVGIATPRYAWEDVYDTGYIGYTPSLTELSMAHGRDAEISRLQVDSPNAKVETGEPFDVSFGLAEQILEAVDAEGLDEDKKAYVCSLSDARVRELLAQIGVTEAEALAGEGFEDIVAEGSSMSYDEFTQTLDQLAPPSSESDYEEALAELDCYFPADMEGMQVYVDSMAARNEVIDTVEAFNQRQSDAGWAQVSLQPSPEIDTFDQSMSVMSTVLVGLGVMSTLVMIVTISSTMGAFARERKHEIGCLRSLGITQRQVEALFVIEALAIGVAAALIGIVLSALCVGILDQIVSPILRYEGMFSFRPVFGVTVLACTLALCAVGAIVPAYRAAHADPAQALKI